MLEQNAAQLKSGQQNLAQELSQAEKEIQDLKEEMQSMKAALAKLSSDVSSNANAINCGQGQKMNAVTKVCEACEAGTFKTADSHRETSCTAQTKCGQGQFISSDSVKAARTCSDAFELSTAPAKRCLVRVKLLGRARRFDAPVDREAAAGEGEVQEIGCS